MSGTPIRIALIGLGKIARDQHLPSLLANADFALAATVDPAAAGVDGVPHFASFDDLVASELEVDALALCTPPQFRGAIARRAIAWGKHLLLEKPPAASLGEIAAISAHARDHGTVLFTAWHSRFASGVAPAREWLAGRLIDHVGIVWREDVHKWHPRQAWIWEPGGLGVFDPGINALSIATAIIPGAMTVEQADLEVPANRAMPIAARLRLQCAAGAQVDAEFDWRQTGPQTWDITIATDAGTLVLRNGGAVLALPGEDEQRFEDREYPALYEHFAGLIQRGESDADATPLQLVADSFSLARRSVAEEFFDN